LGAGGIKTNGEFRQLFAVVAFYDLGIFDRNLSDDIGSGVFVQF